MENFVVSARKYRPSTFESVVGQSHITITLKNAILRSQLAHAYLFCGPRGVGKTTCARIFAKAINCLHPASDAEACNACESCLAFNEGRSFNIHELDAASNNSVDDIRNLIDQVRIPPQIGRYSVYIIDEVHMLSSQAFNAFLKTLEEPPAHAVFILATTEKHKIIPTILSRCQIYDFNRIRVEDSVKYLQYIAAQENVAYDDESLHIIAQKADGGMRDALSMFDKVVSFCGSNLTRPVVAGTLNVLDYDTYFTMTDRILSGDYTEALLLFDEILRKGFSGSIFVTGLNAHFRDLMMSKNPQTLPLLEVTGSVAEHYKEQALRCPVPMLFEGINLLTILDASMRTATNQRLHVELGLMKLCGLGQKKNNDSLISVPELPPLVQDKEKGITVTEQQPNGVASGGTQAEPMESVESSASVIPRSETAQEERSIAELPSEKSNLPERNSNLSPRTDIEDSAMDWEHRSVGEKGLIPKPVVHGVASSSNVSLSGRSILSLLNTQPLPCTAEEIVRDEDMDIEEFTDESLPDKVTQGCVLLSKELMRERPRLGVAFHDAAVEGYTVRLKVPNESLYDEVIAHLSDLRKRLCVLSGVTGQIEFKVEIMENQLGLLPVKVEDRLRYLTEKNPLLQQLRHTLDLDVE